MWKALTTVPRLTKEEWDRSNGVTKWLVATRAGVLPITLFSCLITGLMASRENLIDYPVFGLVTLGLTLAHCTNNLLNDFVDWHKGVDRDNYFRNRYGTHPMSVMTAREMMWYIACTGLAALLVGIYLIHLRGLIVFYLTLAGAFFLLFYTWPLKYIGLGEVSVFIVWGLLMVGGGYYTVTNKWDWLVCIASIPYSLSATSIIMGKHIDKLYEDQKKGIKTLPVVIGHHTARLLVIVMVVFQYLMTLWLVYNGFFSPAMLVCLIGLVRFPKLYQVFSKDKPSSPPSWYPQDLWPMWYVVHAFVHNFAFGSGFVIGLVADTFLIKAGLFNKA